MSSSVPRFSAVSVFDGIDYTWFAGKRKENAGIPVVLPMGKPILITFGTFAGLGYWNDWTNGLYYISRHKEFYNVQNLLNQMVSNIQYLATSTTNSGLQTVIDAKQAQLDAWLATNGPTKTPQEDLDLINSVK